MAKKSVSKGPATASSRVKVSKTPGIATRSPDGVGLASSLLALERIWAVVEALPVGRVISYGEVAAQAGLRGRARLVGRALKVAPVNRPLPWHRVLLSSGHLAFPPGSEAYRRQVRLLKAEGIEVENGRVKRSTNEHKDLDALLWQQSG